MISSPQSDYYSLTCSHHLSQTIIYSLTSPPLLSHIITQSAGHAVSGRTVSVCVPQDVFKHNHPIFFLLFDSVILVITELCPPVDYVRTCAPAFVPTQHHITDTAPLDHRTRPQRTGASHCTRPQRTGASHCTRPQRTGASHRTRPQQNGASHQTRP